MKKLHYIGLTVLGFGFVSLFMGWMACFPAVMIIVGGLALACLPSK